MAKIQPDQQHDGTQWTQLRDMKLLPVKSMGIPMMDTDHEPHSTTIDENPRSEVNENRRAWIQQTKPRELPNAFTDLVAGLRLYSSGPMN